MKCKNATGTCPAEVYKKLYGLLKAAGVGGRTKTFVYPLWVREVVRERFSEVALYDGQYDNRSDVYYVIDEDLWDLSCDIGDCARCNQSMPLTP